MQMKVQNFLIFSFTKVKRPSFALANNMLIDRACTDNYKRRKEI